MLILKSQLNNVELNEFFLKLKAEKFSHFAVDLLVDFHCPKKPLQYQIYK